MARLSIRKLIYSGSKYTYESPWLNDGINILEGDNGTGKTTFSELIYFGLGGRVESFQRNSKSKHSEITSDKDNFVELIIEVGGQQFKLRRFIDTNDVGIADTTGRVEVLPVYRQKTTPRTFSDWLLDQLGIHAVTIFSLGDISGKISFYDLARLIYHDQSPDPSGIYKAADSTTFISDSKAFRKAVFEILIGKTFQALYISIARLKELDKRRGSAADSLEYFKRVIRDIRPNQEDLNLHFLDKRIVEITEQLERATVRRRVLTELPPRRSAVDTTSRKNDLLAVELESATNVRRQNELLSEMTRLERLRTEMVLEVIQIKKMMFAHDKLNLFSINTCPNCLREVNREVHRCICGAEVDEQKYERFFYGSDEYLSILKSKQRNVDTIETAIASCREEAGWCGEAIAQLKNKADAFKAEIAKVVDQADAIVDIAQFDQIDQLIVTLRSELSSLELQKDFEARRDDLERKLADLENRHSAALTEFNALQAQADREMGEQRAKFSSVYQKLMVKNVQQCRTASIDSDYMPVLNGGEYREASAEVPKRLFYFTTLLNLSLDDADVKFPRFLLIDTPETAGIDADNLINALEELRRVVDSDSPPECQVILTTGINKYPESCKSFVFATMPKGDHLLKLRQQNLPLHGDISGR